MRTNSDLCHLQHKLIGFYNRDEKCLQRGTDCVFKLVFHSSWRVKQVFRPLISVLYHILRGITLCIFSVIYRQSRLDYTQLSTDFPGELKGGRSGTVFFLHKYVQYLCYRPRSWQQKSVAGHVHTNGRLRWNIPSRTPQIRWLEGIQLRGIVLSNTKVDDNR